MAGLCGVNVDCTISLTFVMGAALAAVAGVMATLYYGVIDFFIGFLAGVKAFNAVLGGIGSIPAPCWAACCSGWSKRSGPATSRSSTRMSRPSPADPGPDLPADWPARALPRSRRSEPWPAGC